MIRTEYNMYLAQLKKLQKTKAHIEREKRFEIQRLKTVNQERKHVR